MIGVEASETQWVFSPHEPWSSGEHRVTALSSLEDAAGNRVGRPFEVPFREGLPRQRNNTEASIPFIPNLQ